MNTIKKSLQILVLTSIGIASISKASTLGMEDFSFSTTINGVAGTPGVYTAVIGQWNSSTSLFTAFATGTSRDGYGYFDTTANGPELIVSLNQTSQVTGFSIASGTPIAIALFNAPDSSETSWSNSSSFARAVLTDASWTAPAWTPTGGDKQILLTANTTAVVGTFSYNGGDDIIGLTNGLVAIPEPSVASLLALGTVGLVALRVRRKS